jgi:hypothetical protein
VGAGMIAAALRDRNGTRDAVRPGAAERLAVLARRAASDHEAIEAVRQALEEMLT